MSEAYDASFEPPVPVLTIRLAAPGESPRADPLSAILDTGADGSLIPTRHLELAEAIGVGEALLRTVLGEVREVHLYEVDVHFETLTLPSILVAGDDQGNEVLLGRNILNKIIVLLDGQSRQTDLLESRPRWR